MKKLLIALTLMLAATPAFAQGASCDKPALSGTINITNATYLFAIGVPSGQPAPAGFKVTVDGVTTDVGALPPAGTSATGEVCFNATVTVTNCNHTVTTAFYTLDGGGAKQTSSASAPFVLSLGSLPPSAAPINHPR